MTYKQRCEIMEKALMNIIHVNTAHPWMNSSSPFISYMKQTAEIAQKALKESK